MTAKKMQRNSVKRSSLLWVFALAHVFPAIVFSAAGIALSDEERQRIDDGEIVVRELTAATEAGKIFAAFAVFSAPRSTIMKVLTEYKQYPQFMPNVSHIDIVAHKSGESILNYGLSLPLGKIKKYRLKMTASEPDKFTSLLKWQLQKWPGLTVKETIRDTTGYWEITEESKNKSLVLYHVYTDPGPIPFGLGWIVDALSKDSIPNTLQQTRARAESLAGVEEEK